MENKSDTVLRLLREMLFQSAADDSKVSSNYNGFLYFVCRKETQCDVASNVFICNPYTTTRLWFSTQFSIRQLCLLKVVSHESGITQNAIWQQMWRKWACGRYQNIKQRFKYIYLFWHPPLYPNYAVFFFTKDVKVMNLDVKCRACATNTYTRPDKTCMCSSTHTAALNCTEVSNCVACFVKAQCSWSVG